MRITLQNFGHEFQSIVTELINAGHNDNEIRQFLQENHSIIVSQRTLTRRKEDWGLILHASQQMANTEEHIKKYFDQGLTYSQIHHALTTSHNYTHSKRTLQRKITAMQLSRRLDDLDTARVTIEAVVSCVMHLHLTPEGRNVGYRRMRQLLQTKFGITLHYLTVALINRTLDPDGVENRAKRVLKRRVFKTPGPNYIWSADGHDKLKKFGITLYGFIDAWSRKILGIYVHITNNNPRHIGYYYLQLVKEIGGIPRRTSTDKGTETIHLASHQINLTQQYNEECIDPTQSHLFTKSTHNQKIECLWSQLMKRYNSELINKLFTAIEESFYDPQDPLEQLLFIYLWVPLVQRSLDDWMNNYNTYKRRLDKKSSLPTRCSADWCFNYPEEQGGEQGLIKVTGEAADALEKEFYPEGDELLRTTPKWFSDIISDLQAAFDLAIPIVTVHNVWEVFTVLNKAIRAYDTAWLSDPSNDPSLTIAARSLDTGLN
ncbi:uncharacterized protein PGTG_21418 [Puccinia graminis f. sp. tritici CRL 75-36-700-3]|uniref:Integrase catalytic domain-containing protein n=2 Tax=Puccinia graminis f. sp. tritici TaxID=56615 RepID=H6QR97_PUCGT|nr:uncharacterized protein PGTG_21418 [Puccinia graminis f. sp. tritici CRL 75-36-700-3]EHS63088.1 hypothetical protein PGTG_21418 [Puccinia graminis f. sp. tritici CRL 75-36-700-3]